MIPSCAARNKAMRDLMWKVAGTSMSLIQQ